MLSNKELGHYLKSVREQLGYSTYDVNKLCDISQSYLSLMENGKRKPSAVILKKLAPIYSLDYIDLYEKAGYIDLIEDEKRNKIDSFRYASNNGLDTEGLTDEEIEELKEFIRFKKSLKKKKD